MNERKYFVRMNWRFNLDSMMDSLWLVLHDMEDGTIQTAEIMGEEMDYDAVWNFREEVGELLSKATCGKVTGKEYGRIKAISDERNMWRYSKCLEAGMSEEDAALAFFD